MAIDINFNSQNKHWILVILGKIKSILLLIWSYIVKVIFWVGHLLKRAWKILVGLAALFIIIAAGAWGYDYYILNEAVADIIKKYESCRDSEKYELAYNLLRTDYNYGYEGVSDFKIRERLQDLREKAFKYIEEQAYAGKANCQYGLGQLYFYGNNYISKNENKAAYWWNEAANQGYTRAFNQIGIAYKEGIGAAIDMRKAVEWLKKGAEAGEDYAQKNYGDLFRDGVKVKIGSHNEEYTTMKYQCPNDYKRSYYTSDYRKVYVKDKVVDDYEELIPKNIEQAKFWWKKAAAQGNEQAKEALQQIYN